MRGKSIVSVPEAGLTVQEALTKFLRDCQIRNLRPATIETYENFIKSYVEFIGAETDVSHVTKDSIEEWILYEQKKEIKDVTVVSKVRNVRAWVYFLMRESIIPEFKINLPKCDDVYKEPYTDEELARLLATPTSHAFVEWRTWALIAFLIGTGCRISTALVVRICDLNFSEGYVKFTHLKNRHIQLTPISSELKKILMTYLSLWQYTEEDYLFNNSYETGPIAKSTAQQEIKRYNNSRGIKKTSAHLFRHTFSKNYILAGGGVFQLQRILGHADISTTRHYVQLYNADLLVNYDNLCPLDVLLNKRKE